MQLDKLLRRLLITAKIRSEWYKAIARTTEEGLPIYDVLQRMSEYFRRDKHPMAYILNEVLLKLRSSSSHNKTYSIGAVLMDYVPIQEAMLISAGEQAGNLANGFRMAAVYMEANLRMRSVIRKALTKPVIYIIALMILLLFFARKLLPTFEMALPRHKWPESAQLLGSVADHILLINIGIVTAGIACAVIMAYIAPRWYGHTRIWLDKHVFPFTLVAALNGVRLLLSISAYLQAGIPIVDAIRNIGNTSKRYMERQCSIILNRMRRGERAEEAIIKLPIIPNRYHWIISVYGMSQDIAAIYKAISEEMIQNVERYIATLFDGVINNILLVIVGSVIFWIYSSMFAIVNTSTSGI